MKAIGYVRVSTSEQGTEERFSLPHQKEHIKEECKARGWELIGLYEDTESGKSTRKRKGFKAAIEAMKNADILIVHELDRLSRNMKDTIVLIDDLQKLGKKFVSIHDNVDSSDQMGELQLHILTIFAHYFRKQLGNKVHGSMKTRAEQGKYNTKPPLGYKLEEGKLVINPDEEWIVVKIFQMYLENVGFRGIAKYLNSLGMKTRQGAEWNTYPIKRILGNQVYIGNTVWNKTKRSDTKEQKRPESEWITIENTHPAIIDKETFQKVQERTQRKAQIGGRAQSSDYLLSGLVKCGQCGGPMIGNKNVGRTSKVTGQTKVYQRYVCSTYHKKGTCSYNFVHKKEIETKVIDYIRNYVGSPEEARANKAKKTTELFTLKKQREKLAAELAGITQKYQRQKEAFENGVYDIKELKEAKVRVREQENAIKKELSQIDKRLSSFNEQDYIKQRVSDFYEEFEGKDLLQQKAWLQQKVFEIVYFNNEKIEVIFNA